MALWVALNGLLLIGAYLLGSIPPGYWAGRLLKGIDIREHGSGSTGATNVLRTVGKVPALVVLLIDVFKGAAAIALIHWFYVFVQAQTFLPSAIEITLWLPWMITLSGMAALLGHSKSVFLGFTGGKSVATSLGVLLAMSWIVGVGTLTVFALVLAMSRIVSLSSIAGAIAVSGFMLLTHQPLPYILFGLLGGLYVILRHRSNIQRLLSGDEPQLGQTVPEASSQPPS
ncbi:glycerol-3-phosphate 1-O-acyltransferase PlsY [Phormidium sp. FACHB-592]|uniref:Glycerol-3-phosphate acyltransferase n=1 Tax=Stenomitos frigidus AS-A4 TaxID=2933935 RepID=A0ABV0KE23_9CYAN|nr:glycerol-3-phosphate 1-O-acyltransferase PlsY [Phormidium sp. FACHB-592]MBD2075910.1 glycerol-3-phosphate 1-O-acyltransferase PlsY [Phormidium sp. FACHB-592]